MDGGSPPSTELRQFLREAIRSRAIITSTQQRIVSRRGQDRQWLMDLRRISLDPRGLSAIAELFWLEFAPQSAFQICGLEASAIPILSAIQIVGQRLGRDVNAFFVRKERKESGLARRIEGEVTDAPILAVDDIVNSASSLDKVRSVVADFGRRIDWAFSVIDYRSRRGQAWFTRHGVAPLSVFTLSDFDLHRNAVSEPARRWTIDFRWEFASPNANQFQSAPRSTPASDGTRIYAGSDAGILWAIDAGSGEPAWHYQVPGAGPKGIRSSPVVHEGRVYFGAYDGGVYCLGAADGSVLWRFSGADWVGSSPALAPSHGLLFIGFEHATPGRRGGIAALNMEDGAKRWELVVPEFVHGSPFVDADQRWVACGTNGGDLWCLEIPTGRTLWRHVTGGAIKGAPAQDRERDLLVVGSSPSISLRMGC